MVRVISLEQALAQGETPASIHAIIEWHEAALDELERPRMRSTKAMSKPERARARRRHEDTISALVSLRVALLAALTAKAA